MTAGPGPGVGTDSGPGRRPATGPARRRRACQAAPQIAARLKRTGDGLVAAIAQDATSGAVLMLAWMNDDALARTLATREATYWSRSRQELWVKGATSGHTQHVRSVALDCDGDAVLRVDQTGGAGHTGAATCFDADVLLAEEPA